MTNPKYMCLEGDIVPFADARVHVLDPAMKYAAHVFEGMRGWWNADAALTTKRVQAQSHLYAPGTTMKAYNYDMKLMNFMQPEALPLLTQALLQRGYSDTDVRGILGENLLRVASQVWAA